jgi:hypothetical protein
MYSCTYNGSTSKQGHVQTKAMADLQYHARRLQASKLIQIFNRTCSSTYTDATAASSGARPVSWLSQLHFDATLGGSGDGQSLIIVSGGYSAASLSIFFSDLSADYKYSNTSTGLRDTYPQGMFFIFPEKFAEKDPPNSLFQTTRGSEATYSECTFFKSAHHSKILRSAT